ncbi:MAG: hypothetical protein INQ03_23835 [Candidatus Heimdallarchaeota archaeon]|nr:hypothetical protein [Candidatus Heimdallarchaeota archaeon]
MSLSKVEHLYNLGKYDEILNLASTLSYSTILEEMKVRLILSRVYGFRGEYDRGKKVLNFLGQFKKKYAFYYIHALLLRTLHQINKGELSAAKSGFKEYRKLEDQLSALSSDRLDTINEVYNRVLAFYYIEKTEYQEGIKYLQIALQFSTKQENYYLMGLGYYYLGSSYRYLGNIKMSLPFFEKARDCSSKIENRYLEALVENAFGTYYWSIRKYKLALISYQGSLNIWNEIHNTAKKYRVMINMGEVYRVLGNTIKADQYITEAMQYQETHGHSIEQAYALRQLVELHLDSNSAKSNEYLLQLENLKNSHSTEMIDLLYKLSKAIVLNNQDDFITKAESKIILNELINSSVKDIALDAMYLNCNILVQEYEAFKNINSVAAMYDILDMIELYNLNAGIETDFQTMVMQAKIEKAQGDFKQALEILDEVEEKATHYELGLLLIQTRFEKLLIYEDLKNMRNIYKYNRSIIEITNGEDDEVDSLSFTARGSPILIFILDTAGLIRLKYQFTTEDLEMKSNMLGALLSAINSFASEAFGFEGSVDQISYQGFTVTMFKSGELQFVYISLGDDIMAQDKTVQFERMISNSNIYERLLNPYYIEEIPVDDYLEQRINEIFL